ncbi:hypothetical protein GF373_00625 [bacterium]|nr:hypothetical protein [bacterium]
MMKKVGFLGMALLLLPLAGLAQVGIFEEALEIGGPDVDLLSLVEFDNGMYTVETIGETIGYRSYTDEFTFTYMEMSGNFAIEGEPFPLGSDGWGGLMIRQELTNDSVHASLLMASEGATRGTNSEAMSVHPTFRTMKGGATKSDGDPEPGGLTDDHDGKIRLERVGNSFYFYTFNTSGDPVLIRKEEVPMTDPVYVGLAVNSETEANWAVFEFTDVTVEESPFTVERSIPADEVTPGETMQVTLTAKARSGETISTSVHEVPPVRSVFSNVQAADGEAVLNDDGSIDWNLVDFSGEATLTYDVQLGDIASMAWPGTFDDGTNTNNFIAGDAVLPKTMTFPNDVTVVDIDPYFPTKFEIETGVPAEEAMWGLMANPSVPSGYVAMSMNTSSSDVLEFSINIPSDGVWYLFGSTRGEDGNSDSFHFGMDDLPEGTDASRWNISNQNDDADRSHNHDWVEREDPSEDPRLFDLTAGEHIIYLGNREDDASIDYLVVTNNPDIDEDAVDLNAQAIVSRTINNPFPYSGSVEVSAIIKKGVQENAILTEIPPATFPATNVQASDGIAELEADGSISWDLTGVTGKEVTLTYDLQAPAVTGNGGIYGPIDGELVIESDSSYDIAGGGAVGVPGLPVSSSGNTCFYFKRVSSDEVGDRFFESELETVFGLDVVPKDDTNAAGYEMPTDLTGADLAWVSGSVGSGNVASMNYHLNEEVPIVFSEGYLADDYAFQPGEGRITVTGMDIDIIDNTHPITEEFDEGLVQVYQEPGGISGLEGPPDGATVLGVDPNDSNIALLWVVEEGATMNGTTSPEIRVQMFGGVTGMTTQGRQLFNQIVAYALGVDAPEPVAVEDFMLY